MSRFKTIFLSFLFISFICINLIDSKCDSCSKSKKEKNIYTKDANEGDFKHEDEIIDEEEEKIKNEKAKDGKMKSEGVRDVDDVKDEQKEEKLDPEKAKQVLKMIRQLGSQLGSIYTKSFGTLKDAIPEIQDTIQNVTVQVQEEIEKVSQDTGKNLDVVSETVSKVINEAINDFGKYVKVLEEKEKQVKIPESSLEISSDFNSKQLIKLITTEIQGMMSGGNKLKDIMEDMPEALSVIITKTKAKLKEKLSEHEKKLGVGLESVKSRCETKLDEISVGLKTGLQQTSSVLSMTLNTILGLVSTLQSQVQ